MLNDSITLTPIAPPRGDHVIVSSDTPGSREPFASTWLAGFRAAVENGDLPWKEPHVSGSDEEIALEWWGARRKLTAFIRGHQVEVLKVWGANIDSEMESVGVGDARAATAIWQWLLSG